MRKCSAPQGPPDAPGFSSPLKSVHVQAVAHDLLIAQQRFRRIGVVGFILSASSTRRSERRSQGIRPRQRPSPGASLNECREQSQSPDGFLSPDECLSPISYRRTNPSLSSRPIPHLRPSPSRSPNPSPSPSPSPGLMVSETTQLPASARVPWSEPVSGRIDPPRLPPPPWTGSPGARRDTGGERAGTRREDLLQHRDPDRRAWWIRATVLLDRETWRPCRGGGPRDDTARGGLKPAPSRTVR